MINILRSRYYHLKHPIPVLSEEQEQALAMFREKMKDGSYQFESASCLCGGLKGELIASRDRYALLVNTYLCVSCGVMWTNPRLTEESLKRFYEEDYRVIYAGGAIASDLFFSRQKEHGSQIYNYFIESTEYQNRNQMSVFDIGCGAGGILIPFRDAGCSVFGCDIGEAYLKLGRDSGLLLERGGLFSLKKYAPADLIILSHVLEHFSNPYDELLKLSELLKDDGYIYIELPGIFSMHRTYKDPFSFLQNAHLYHFTLSTLVSLMRRARFSLVNGDESIRALFQKKIALEPITKSNPYRKIKFYMIFIELWRIFHINRILQYGQNAIILMRRLIND
jgi:SAM-dependent methyltransferase